MWRTIKYCYRIKGLGIYRDRRIKEPGIDRGRVKGLGVYRGGVKGLGVYRVGVKGPGVYREELKARFK